MEDHRIASLEDIWPLQAELNRRAGFDTLAIGRARRRSVLVATRVRAA